MSGRRTPRPADALLSSGASAVGGAVAGQLGALIGGPAWEVSRAALDRAYDRIRQRSQMVWLFAAHEAGIEPGELDERVMGIPGGEELLIKTLQAAMSVGAERKLVELSRSLASVVRTPEEPTVTFESQLIDVIRDLASAHLRVLEALEVGQRTMDGTPTFRGGRTEAWVASELPDWHGPVLTGLIRALEVHGLATYTAPYVGGPAGAPAGGGREGLWEIAPFGRSALERFRAIGGLLGPEAPHAGPNRGG